MTMPLEEFVKNENASQKCDCGAVIKEHSDEQYSVSKKIVCGDCYFSSLGEVVEKRPIGNPTRGYVRSKKYTL